VTAGECAFDNPSKSMLDFLSSQYTLTEPIEQSNRFVVFKQFFENLQAQHEAVGFSSKQNSRASSRRSSFGKTPMISPSVRKFLWVSKNEYVSIKMTFFVVEN